MKINKRLVMLGVGIATSTGVLAQTFYQCMPCPAGSYASGGKCVKCPAGKYCPTGIASPINCELGTYAAEGSTYCQTCPAGYYCPTPSTKTACPTGTFSQQSGAIHKEVCQSCPNYYWSDPGSTKCGKIQIRIHASYWNEYTNTCSKSSYIWMYASEKEYGARCQYRCDGNWCGWTGGDPAPYKLKGCGRACSHWIGQESSKGKYIPKIFDCKKFPCTGTGAYGTKETYTYPDKEGDVRIVY